MYYVIESTFEEKTNQIMQINGTHHGLKNSLDMFIHLSIRFDPKFENGLCVTLSKFSRQG